MEWILAFVLHTGNGIKVEYSPAHTFLSSQECRKFATSKSRPVILDRYSGRTGPDKVYKVVPACTRYTRGIALKILNKEGI